MGPAVVVSIFPWPVASIAYLDDREPAGDAARTDGRRPTQPQEDWNWPYCPSGLVFGDPRLLERLAEEFQTCTEAASKGPFGRPFQAIHPSVDEFGTLSWPSREEIEALLVLVQ